MAKKIKVTLVRSTIGQKPAKVATVRSLGLKKINCSSVVEVTPAILGMAGAVSHLITIEDVK